MTRNLHKVTEGVFVSEATLLHPKRKQSITHRFKQNHAELFEKYL